MCSKHRVSFSDQLKFPSFTNSVPDWRFFLPYRKFRYKLITGGIYTVPLSITVFSITLKNHSNLIMWWKQQLHIVLLQDLMSTFSNMQSSVRTTAVSSTFSCPTFAFYVSYCFLWFNIGVESVDPRCTVMTVITVTVWNFLSLGNNVVIHGVHQIIS